MYCISQEPQEPPQENLGFHLLDDGISEVSTSLLQALVHLVVSRRSQELVSDSRGSWQVDRAAPPAGRV